MVQHCVTAPSRSRCFHQPENASIRLLSPLRIFIVEVLSPSSPSKIEMSTESMQHPNRHDFGTTEESRRIYTSHLGLSCTVVEVSESITGPPLDAIEEPRRRASAAHVVDWLIRGYRKAHSYFFRDSIYRDKPYIGRA